MEEREGINVNYSENYNESSESIQYRMALESQLNNGATWFYWIAGLSLINTITYMMGSDSSFINGLGITQFVDIIAYELGGVVMYVGFAINILIAGMFILFGRVSKKGKNWAFITGIILYALDSIIFLLAKDWIGLGFHAFAIYGIYGGLKANKALKGL